ncbi:MAG: hypothetical protein ACI9YU_000720 [Flavobacteriales bacterium]|jgi:hypothetical protein
MNKTLKILETLWLVFGLVCLGMAAYTINEKGIDNTESKMLLLGTFLAGVLYAVRRRQRIRSDESSDKPDS